MGSSLTGAEAGDTGHDEIQRAKGTAGGGVRVLVCPQ